MSKENLEQFIQQISGSEELQTRIGDEIDAESLIALGAEHGCEFTAEDLAEHVELSEEELDGVAGGQSAGSQAATRAVVTHIVGAGDWDVDTDQSALFGRKMKGAFKLKIAGGTGSYQGGQSGNPLDL